LREGFKFCPVARLESEIAPVMEILSRACNTNVRVDPAGKRFKSRGAEMVVSPFSGRLPVVVMVTVPAWSCATRSLMAILEPDSGKVDRGLSASSG